MNKSVFEYARANQYLIPKLEVMKFNLILLTDNF